MLLPSPGRRRPRRPDLERQRVPPARRATPDDPHVHAVARRPRGARARRRDRRPRRWRGVRLGGVGRAGRAGGDLRSRPRLHRRPRRARVPHRGGRDGDPRHHPGARRAPRRDAGAGARRSRPPRRPPRAADASRRDRRVVRPRARGASRRRARRRRRATWTSPTAPGCGPPAKQPPCSASAAISSTIGACRARQTSVRGYWKHGRAGDGDDDA